MHLGMVPRSKWNSGLSCVTKTERKCLRGRKRGYAVHELPTHSCVIELFTTTKGSSEMITGFFDDFSVFLELLSWRSF